VVASETKKVPSTATPPTSAPSSSSSAKKKKKKKTAKAASTSTPVVPSPAAPIVSTITDGQRRAFASHVIEPHNSNNEWQGSFRVGWCDLVALRYGASIIGPIDTIAITHADRLHKLDAHQMPAGSDWLVCVSYQYIGHVIATSVSSSSSASSEPSKETKSNDKINDSNNSVDLATLNRYFDYDMIPSSSAPHAIITSSLTGTIVRITSIKPPTSSSSLATSNRDSQLARLLTMCRPLDYVKIPTVAPLYSSPSSLDSTSSSGTAGDSLLTPVASLVATVERHLKIPVTILSSGARALDKTLLREL
jgi:hypothetical protein